MYDPLNPYTMNLDEEGIEEVMAHAETSLLKATHNFEVAVELERRARRKYYDKFHSTFLSLLSGEKEIGDKVIAQSVVEKTSRAISNDEYVDFENAIRNSKKNEEKMNSIKKLLDQRTRLGG